jgi:anti-anti-sigma regulatory factor
MPDDFIVEDLPDERSTLLRIETSSLDLGQRDEVARAFDSLLDSRHHRLVVDLRKIGRIFSLFIGSLVDLKQRSEQRNKRLVILVNPQVRETLERMNLAETLDI